MNYHLDKIVSVNDTAIQAGSGEAEVLATPRLIAFIEEAAMFAAKDNIDETLTTVGTKVCIEHLAATPVGMNVHITAELMEANGRRLVFNVTAKDECEVIATGIHERFIVNKERFMDKALSKLEK